MLKKYCVVVTLPDGSRFSVYTDATDFDTARNIFNAHLSGTGDDLEEVVLEGDFNFNKRVLH